MTLLDHFRISDDTPSAVVNERRPPIVWPRRLAIATLVVLFLLPLVPLVLFSFSKGYFFPQVVPEEWSVRAWRLLLGPESGFWGALARSLMLSTIVTIISLLLAVPAGRALGLYRFRGRGLILFLVLTPLLVPLVSFAMGLDVALIRLGLSDTFGGVAIAHLIPSAPYAVLIMSGAFANYDTAFEQQARSLGATSWKTHRYVMLPAIRTGLIVAAFFAFIVSWGHYLLTLLVGGGRVVTLPLLLFSTATGGDTAVTAALSLAFSAPALAVFVATAVVFRGPVAPRGVGSP